MILFDSNLLVYAHARSSPWHEAAKQLRDQAAEGDLEACLSPQILCEFFAVTTNEKLFKPALTPEQASKEIRIYWEKSNFKKILPKESTIPRLLELAAQRNIQGQHIFDVFLVATMLDNGVHIVYTQNTKDFAVFKEIQAINPFTISVKA